jgi:hypothetical protein
MTNNGSNGLLTRIASIAPTILLSQLAAACAANATNETPRTPVAQRAYIAGSCPAMREQPPQAVPVGVLLEVADVVEPTGVPLKEWLAAHPVEVHHVAKISLPLTTNVPTESPFGSCLNRTCSQNEDATLEVVVIKAPASASEPLELLLNVSSGSRPPRHLSVKTTDQEPVLASLSTPDQTVVVTAYYLFEPKQQSMGKFLHCASQSPRVTASN